MIICGIQTAFSLRRDWITSVCLMGPDRASFYINLTADRSTGAPCQNSVTPNPASPVCVQQSYSAWQRLPKGRTIAAGHRGGTPHKTQSRSHIILQNIVLYLLQPFLYLSPAPPALFLFILYPSLSQLQVFFIDMTTLLFYC